MCCSRAHLCFFIFSTTFNPEPLLDWKLDLKLKIQDRELKVTLKTRPATANPLTTGLLTEKQKLSRNEKPFILLSWCTWMYVDLIRRMHQTRHKLCTDWLTNIELGQ